MRFCENCREDVPYTVEDEILTAMVKSKRYTYDGKIARCTRCGNRIWTPGTRTANLTALREEMRKTK